jgi:hypothetical protein
MKRQQIPSKPPKPASNLPVPDWAMPEPLRVRVKRKLAKSQAYGLLAGAIPELPARMPLEAIAAIVLAIAVAAAADFVRQ